MGTSVTLEFEKPIAELERQIDELKRLAGDQQLDVNEEIAPLEKKLADLRVEIYQNLTPWQRVQVARFRDRPYTNDYLKLIFEDYFELRGDRRFGDDRAIQGGLASL
ncbi:MAG: acetyl-CoA carboxylase carboxyl transferase subunit alpha, partial [Gemmatimonadales bacterium]